MNTDFEIKDTFEKISFEITIENFRDLELFVAICGCSINDLVEFANNHIGDLSIRKFEADEINDELAFRFWKKLYKLFNLYQPEPDFSQPPSSTNKD